MLKSAKIGMGRLLKSAATILQSLLVILLAVAAGSSFTIFTIGTVYVMNGLVIAKLWSWFVTPFFGGPTVTVPLAVGLMMIVGVFTIGLEQAKSTEKWHVRWAALMGAPVLILIIGWVAHLFLVYPVAK